MNHTPGPWVVVRELRKQDEIVADMVNRMWVVPAFGQKLGDNEADAHLIAAAPAMFAALNMLLGRYTALVNCGDCGNSDPETEPEVMLARRILAEATGGTP